jgi:hypothetical protein
MQSQITQLVPKSIPGSNGASPLTVEIVLNTINKKLFDIQKVLNSQAYPLIYTNLTTKRNHHLSGLK